MNNSTKQSIIRAFKQTWLEVQHEIPDYDYASPEQEHRENAAMMVDFIYDFGGMCMETEEAFSALTWDDQVEIGVLAKLC